METRRFVVNKEEHSRLDKVISEHLSYLSRSKIQKLIEQGFVQVNGEVSTLKNRPVTAGDDVTIKILEDQVGTAIQAEKIPIKIEYEDDYLVVVYKPKGMVVHPGIKNREGTLVNGLISMFGEKLSNINGEERPGIVHRIDKDTAGLLMVAKDNQVHKGLAEQLKDHSLTRQYVALLHHNIKEDSVTIDAMIGRNKKNPLKRQVAPDGGKRAVTHLKVIERFGRYTLVEARLETGRTHQIRVHAAHINHAVVGDPLYGSGKEELKVEGQLLEAVKLGFLHPITGKYMEFNVDISQELSAIIKNLREQK